METLEIQNFLTIKEAKLEVRPFTIIIGPQANGKSVVVKLLYFFREFLSTQFIRSVGTQDTMAQLGKEALQNFEQIFPKYTWSDQTFKIIYEHHGLAISVTREVRGTKKLTVKLTTSKSLVTLQKRLKAGFKKEVENIKKKKVEGVHSSIFDNEEFVLQQYIKRLQDSAIGSAFGHSIFIPASRSFFANLQKNVFYISS